MATNQPTGLMTHILEEWYDSRDFKVMLVDPDWVPNRTTSLFRSSVTAHEVTGTNWPAGGVTCSLVVSEVSATFQSVVTLQALTVANVTTTDPARYAVIYEVTGNAATDRIIRWHDLGGTATFTAEAVQIDAADFVITLGPDR